MTRNSLISVMLTFTSIGMFGGIVAGQESRTNFLVFYSPVANKVRDAFTNVTCRTATTIYTKEGSESQVTDCRVKCNFRNFTFEVVSDKTFSLAEKQWRDRPISVQAQNTRYGFSLVTTGADKQRVMSGMRPATGATKPNLAFLCVPYANQQPAGRSYLDLIQDPATKVLRFSDATFRNQTCKEVVVEYTTLHPTTRKPLPLRNAFYFLPDLHWLCCGCRLFDEKDSSKAVIEEVYEYEPRSGEMPALKAVEQWMLYDNTQAGGRLNRRTVVAEFKRSAAPFPDSDFRLSAYGFPEPEGFPDLPVGLPVGPSVEADALSVPDAPPRSRALWLAGVAGILVVFAVAFFVARRRAAGRTAVPNGAAS